jgi:hypothetical protein
MDENATLEEVAEYSRLTQFRRDAKYQPRRFTAKWLHEPFVNAGRLPAS